MKYQLDEKVESLKKTKKITGKEAEIKLKKLNQLAFACDNNKLTDEMLPSDNRLDKYIADLGEEIGFSFKVHLKNSDEYFLINKDKEVINVTDLTYTYNKLPLSTWLHKNGGKFFGTKVPLKKELDWGFNLSDIGFLTATKKYMEVLDKLERHSIKSEKAGDYFSKLYKESKLLSLDVEEYTYVSKGFSEYEVIFYVLNAFLLNNTFLCSCSINGAESGDLLIDVRGELVDVFPYYKFLKEKCEDPIDRILFMTDVINLLHYKLINSELNKTVITTKIK